MSGRADCCSSEKRLLFSTGRYHYPGLKEVHSLNQTSCPSGLTEMETITEETLGIPAKHLQCAAARVLHLNFKPVSLGPGDSEATEGQSFAQAYYCFLRDYRVGESLWMANCLSVGRAGLPLPIKQAVSMSYSWAGVFWTTTSDLGTAVLFKTFCK